MIRRTILLASFSMLAASAADGATFAVTTMADAGAGSLRWAIEQANALPGPDEIVFHHVVSEDDCGPDDVFWLDSPLPAIIDELKIDGYTANLSQAPSDHPRDAIICVRLQPEPNPSQQVPVGLRVSSLAPNDVSLDVRGLKFNGFSLAGIELPRGSQHVIKGNIFGGGDAAANGHGIVVGPQASTVWIGHAGPEDDTYFGNWIAGSAIAGMRLDGNEVSTMGTVIVPDAAGSPQSLNSVGIVVGGSDFSLSYDNVENSVGDGIVFTGSASGWAHVWASKNGGDGARAESTGGQIELNGWFVDNGGAGVRVEDGVQGVQVMPFSGSGRWLGNGGLGIDLGTAGRDANDIDALAPANAANLGQNHPVLATAAAGMQMVGSVFRGRVAGVFSSRPSSSYYISIFQSDQCDPTRSEGKRHVGSATVALGVSPPGTDATTSFTMQIESHEPLVDSWLTAVATHPVRGTSEFSDCILVDIANQAPSITSRTFVLNAAQNMQPVTLGPLVHSDDGLPNPPGTLSFSIPGNTTPFSVSNTGHITGTPDFAANPGGYQFAVEVSDGELTGQATVKILRNAAPVIADRYLYLPNSKDGSSISLVADASDDGYPNPPAKVSYAITTPGMPFSISDTGLITGIASVATQPAGGYVFDIEAGDGELSGHAKVHVQMNTPPVLADRTFTIPFHDFGTSVDLGFLSASDDGFPVPAHLTYSAPGENTPFYLRSDGMLTGIADFTGAPNGYTLLVKVSDKEAESQATIRIVPGPANLAPVMSDTTFVLDDSQHMQPVVLGPLSASDDGLGVPAGTLTFHEHNYTIFTVSSDGLITGTPNFKTAPQGYTIEVLVSDGDLDTIAKVRIAPETIFRASFDQ